MEPKLHTAVRGTYILSCFDSAGTTEIVVVSLYVPGRKLTCFVKGVKTEWVQVWANSIYFAIDAVKSKQTYQTSKIITTTW